ncbi:hemolysin expression modulator Hha [Enterobacteriaceae bacterium Kacie_13]|nr:hemolysin expression modulator Hha [Enterobacteriaceae bacterium Kacie_13]
MNKLDWLLKLRKCQSIDTLEKIIEYHKYNETGASQDEAFYSAVDHRLAELTVGRNFDKVPASVWSLVK